MRSMETLKLFTGSPAGSVTVRGKHCIRLASFALRYPGWHTMAKDRTTLRAVSSLVRLRIVETSGDQFRWNDTREV